MISKDCEQQQQQLFSQYLHHHHQQQNIVSHETSYIYHPEPLLPTSTNGDLLIQFNVKKFM